MTDRDLLLKNIDKLQEALSILRKENIKIRAAILQFADPKNWYDEPGRLQWAGKRHAIEYASSVLDINVPLKLEGRPKELEPKLKIYCELPELLPKRIHEDDSGLDIGLNLLGAGNNLEVLASSPPKMYLRRENGVVLLPTGLYVEFPKGFDLQIRPRSGLAVKGFTIVNSPGTIDAGFRGEIKIIAYNLSDRPIMLIHGQKIAQAVLTPIVYPGIEVVESKEELGTSQRGEGGFGSTGL